jgi:hypothetical protein
MPPWLLRASLDGPLNECVPTLFLFPLLTFAQSTPQGTAVVPAFALEDGTWTISCAAPVRELNCVVAAGLAESPYLRLGLLQ